MRALLDNVSKQLTPDQSFETNIVSDKMLIVKFHFMGQKWEDFAKVLFKKFPIAVIGYFVGGETDINSKTATIRGGFSHEAFMDKYGKLMPDWTFKIDPRKRWHMPTKGREDLLSYFINGRNPLDIQNEIFE